MATAGNGNNGNGNGGTTSVLVKKVADSVFLTAVGRVTLLALGPFLIYIVTSIIDLKTIVAVQGTMITLLTATVDRNHNDSQQGFESLTSTIANKLSEFKTQMEHEMDLRSKVRDAQQNEYQRQLDELRLLMANYFGQHK